MRLAYETHVMNVDSHMRSSFAYLGPHSQARMDIHMQNVQIFACRMYRYLHAECTDICMRNARELHTLGSVTCMRL